MTTTPATDNMIELKNVTKRYGTATVVDDVSMSVRRGSITVIVGTSAGSVTGRASSSPACRS